MTIPQDPVILLSYVNTKLRDYYNSLDEMCKSLDINIQDLNLKLNRIDYYYNPKKNQFQ